MLHRDRMAALSHGARSGRTWMHVPLAVMLSAVSACGAFSSTGRSSGREAPVTENNINALRARILQCWNVAEFVKDPDVHKLYAVVEFSLKRDGAIDERPVVKTFGGGAAGSAFAARAVEAVTKCAPYGFLPPEQYGQWSKVEISFAMGAL